jgi:hypothetical protein
MLRADLNMHRASSKRIQNKNDNLNDFEPKHKNFISEHEIKKQVL